MMYRRMEPGAWSILGRCFTVEPYPLPQAYHLKWGDQAGLLRRGQWLTDMQV